MDSLDESGDSESPEKMSRQGTSGKRESAAAEIGGYTLILSSNGEFLTVEGLNKDLLHHLVRQDNTLLSLAN